MHYSMIIAENLQFQILRIKQILPTGFGDVEDLTVYI
jgi:hypothetical protein